MIRSGTALFRSIVLALCLCTTSAVAQRPDFNGVWSRVADSAREKTTVAATGDASFERGDAGSGWGSPITITQRPERMTVDYAVFSAYDLQPPLHLTFALDGSTSGNSIMLGHSASALRSTTSWKDGTLTITTHYPGPTDADGRPIDVQVKQLLRLESPTTLVIETTRTGILGGRSTTSRTIYTKQ